MELDELRTRLARFCQSKYNDPEASVDEVTVMPGHAGFAYGFTVTTSNATDRWFLRLPPPKVRWVGTGDMLRQVTALEALEGSAVPHCRVRWYGGPDDTEWFDRPYFIVEQLQGGDVLMGGSRRSRWVLDLAADTRRAMGRAAMAALAGIHRVDWRSRCRYLGEPVLLEDEVTRWDRFIGRAADPTLLADTPALRQLLLDRLPDATDVGLVHGDFQFSNLYYSRTGELEAVLDWELCGIGPTLIDVGWIATFNDPAAWAHEGAIPDGMPDADELVAMYADVAGSPLADVAWFRALAAYKFAIIAGFNLGLHRRGKRPDSLWERIGTSIASLQGRARELLAERSG
jgi:aminoglycoside phosphotransferase (APT) family kinase protein